MYRKTSKHSCTSDNYTFSFNYPQYFYAPITLYETASNSYYDNNQNNIRFNYEVYSDGGVYKFKYINYESSINEIINIVINVKGSKATDYFLLSKPENSYELTFRVSDETNGTGCEGSVNLLSEVSMNEKN